MPSEVLYNSDFLNYHPEEIIDTFNSCTEILKKDPPFIFLGENQGEVIFVGDTHGDFSATKFIASRFLKNQVKYLVFLGDYVDREPEPEGSLFNLLYICLLKINFPHRVFILKGNHEANYSVCCHPYEFEQNLIDIFGTIGREIHKYAVELFKEMPLMLQTINGIVSSHAGFPMRGQKVNHKSREDLILDILWADVDVSPMFRGYGIPKFTEAQLVEFLENTKAKCFIRGHDPYMAGKIIYSNKCITIFTSRSYAFRSGIKIVKAELSKNINDARDLTIEDITSYLIASE